MRLSKPRKQGQLGISMTPMIDIVFLLIIFFMTVSQITLLGLLVAIPTLVALSYFRNKIDSLVAEAGKRVERALLPLARKRS